MTNIKAKINFFSKWTYIKIGGFLLYLSMLLLGIVLFGEEYLKTLYGSSIMHGFGIITLAISWGFWSVSLNKEHRFHFVKIAAIMTMILGMCLIPNTASFILGSIIILGEVVSYVLKEMKS